MCGEFDRFDFIRGIGFKYFVLYLFYFGVFYIDFEIFGFGVFGSRDNCVGNFCKICYFKMVVFDS